MKQLKRLTHHLLKADKIKLRDKKTPIYTR